MDPEHSHDCCSVKTMCGTSLLHGVVIVGVSTIVISGITLMLSLFNLTLMACTEEEIYTRSTLAMDLCFGMVATSISVYQIIISGLLLWQALKTKGIIYLCSLWYVSHLSILTLYFFMFCARMGVCFQEGRYFAAVVTIVMCITYNCTFIYFEIVVNSYLHSLNHARYL